MSELPKKRYDDNIKTRNFRLKRTSGTRTKFTLDDKRSGIKIDFDTVEVGPTLGRGDTITMYVECGETENSGNPRAASLYCHDVCDHLLEAFEHIEEHGELPEADYVKVKL